MAIFGRVNPVLEAYLARYRERHPDLRCLTRVVENGRFWYRDSATGERFEGGDRESYMRMMRLTRIGLYSTPGMDGANPDANGFNQVTPRFLEYLASGCHVLARYPRNSDTAYFEMEKFAENVSDYEQFESAMVRCLAEPFDKEAVRRHLARHKTSTRAEELRKILGELP